MKDGQFFSGGGSRGIPGGGSGKGGHDPKTVGKQKGLGAHKAECSVLFPLVLFLTEARQNSMTRNEYYDQQSQTSVVIIDAFDFCDVEAWWKSYLLLQITYWQNE